MTRNTEAADAPDGQRTDEADRPTRGRRVRSAVAKRAGDGTVAAAVGGLLLVGAARTARQSRRRAGALAAAGSALFGVALRQRRSGGETDTADGEAAGSTDAEDGTSKVSAEAHAHRMASDTVNPTETNPRGVADEPDVDADADEGHVRFSTGQDEATEQKPHVDEVDPKDPRYPDEGEPGSEDPVDVSLSNTKTTDELGKVASPDDDQAYPAREGTDPEPMAEEAPPRNGEGAVANPDSDEADDQTDEEAQADEEAPPDDESGSRDEEST